MVNKNYFYLRMDPIKIEIQEKQKFKKAIWVKWKKALEHMDKSDQLAVKTYFKHIQDNNQTHITDGHKIPPRIAM